LSVTYILGDEKSNNIIPHRDVITDFFRVAFVRVAKRKKRKGRKTRIFRADVSGWLRFLNTAYRR